MPKPQEIAILTVNGQKITNWKTVAVVREYGGIASSFSFSISETNSPVPSAADWSKLRVKNGDECTVTLAGELAVTGFVFIRQVVGDATSHGVQIQGKSRTGDVVDSAAVAKGGQFKNFSFEAISKKLIEPFGLKMTIYGDTGKPFENFSIQQGETAHAAIERMARQRGIVLSDDKDGNIVATASGQPSDGGDALVEGENIKSFRIIRNDESLFSKTTVISQKPGSDDAWGDDARDVHASIDNPSMKRYRPTVITAEHPGNSDDLKKRAENEAKISASETIECTIVVYGWLMKSGKLWNYGLKVPVKSPMMMLDDSLIVRRVTFMQDESGTTTQLDLCTENALAGFLQPSVPGNQPDVLGGGGDVSKEAQAGQPSAVFG